MLLPGCEGKKKEEQENKQGNKKWGGGKQEVVKKEKELRKDTKRTGSPLYCFMHLQSCAFLCQMLPHVRVSP